MALISKPIMFLAVGGAAVALILAQQDDKPTASAKPKPKSSKKTVRDTDLLPDDYSSHFAKAVITPKNVFMPLVSAKDTTKTLELDLTPPQDQDKIPQDLAGGEAGWVFTGFATVDGKDMALLENSTNHQGGFVKAGDPWKATRIVRITPQSVVMKDKNGIEKVVLRFDPNKPKPSADASSTVKPIDPGPALRGPIGGPSGNPGGGPGGGPGGRNPGMSIQQGLPPGVTISDGPVIIRG